MMWFKRSGWGIHCDVVNLKLFELQAAKEILAEIYDIQFSQVDDLIQQRITERLLFESGLYLYTIDSKIHLS
ncbi:MAG: hypothetical protein MUO26_15235 [Methanotrichaceae archaeon]|nr:hypothetical protein [Methanotrichaceae archaeon]